jgi:hypothetical protein
VTVANAGEINSEIQTTFCSQILKTRDHFEDTGLYVSIALN